MQNVAMTIFESYSKELEGIIPLSQDDIAPADFKNRNALILNIKVLGEIGNEGEELLEEGSSTTELTIEGSLLDSKTKQALLTFCDQKKMLITDGQSFLSPAGMEAFSQLTDAWAASLATFLFTMRR